MLEIPKRTAAPDSWGGGEVVCRRRPIRGPFESPRIPRIVSRGLAPIVGPEQISQEDQNRNRLEENSHGHNEVPGVPTAPRLVSVDSSRHAQQSWNMHKVEGQVKADKKKPEMQPAERLAVHLPRHFREPVVKSSEKTEENAAHNHIVKMRDHEV